MGRFVFSLQVATLLFFKKQAMAEAICRRKLVLRPTSSFYHRWLGRTLYQQRRLIEAIQEQRLAIARYKITYSADRIDLIRMLLEAKQYQEVIVECQRLIDPQFHQVSGLFKAMHLYAAYENMYKAYLEMGEYLKAKEAISQMLLFHKGKARQQIAQKIEEIEKLIQTEGQSN